MFHCRISSNINDLNTLNKQFNWIPNEYTIRPNNQSLQLKKIFCSQILEKYKSFNDYIYQEVFRSNTNNKWIFMPSYFTYNVHHKTNHFVLWNSELNMNFDYNDIFINNKIKEELNKITPFYDFVWYKNPNPTVMDYYHIQVFWIKL